MNKKTKGALGCLTCGTSLGCLFPLATLFGIILAVAASSYFDTSYRWDKTDTWMVVGLAVIVIPLVLLALLQAAVGIWGLAGFFDSDVKPEELSLLTPIPSVDGGKIQREENRER